MQILDHLDDEHHLIERVLEAFGAYLDAVEHDHDVERHDLYRFVTFFSDFTDALHHAKEETVLFPALERRGFAPKVGPLGHIRDQHSHERVLFARLKRAATEQQTWSTQRLDELIGTGRELIDFERGHIIKESELLFPRARAELAGEDSTALDKALSKFERIHDVEGYTGYLEQLAEELIRRYAPEVDQK